MTYLAKTVNLPMHEVSKVPPGHCAAVPSGILTFFKEIHLFVFKEILV